MVDGLSHCKKLLQGFGGHPIAAGLSIKAENIDDFKTSFLEIANTEISKDTLKPLLKIDAKINLSEINGRFLKFLYSLEPFGPGNTRPVFSAENVRIEGMPKLIGKNFDTIKFNVKQNQTIFETIGFNMADHFEKLLLSEPINISFSIGENVWNGRRTIQLELKDIKVGGV